MSKVLDNKLHAAIDTLNDTQKKAVLGIVTVLAASPERDHWADDNFVSEMKSRLQEYKTGKVIPISLEEVHAKARKAAQKANHRKAI